MANELKMPHVAVSGIYMAMQLVISMIAIYVIPDTIVAHWMYFIGCLAVLCIGYVVFVKKYYHLHEEYLAGVKSEK